MKEVLVIKVFCVSEAMANDAMASLTEAFGGATAYPHKGAWYNGTKVEIEDGFTVMAYTNASSIRELETYAMLLADILKERYNQQTVLIAIGREHISFQ